MQTTTQVQTGNLAVAFILAKLVAGIDIGHQTPVRVEWPSFELIAEQVEVAFSKVKQRADRRIGLAVVITEVAFVVAVQFRNTPVAEQLPVIRKALVQLDFNAAINVDWIGKTIRHTIPTWIA